MLQQLKKLNKHEGYLWVAGIIITLLCMFCSSHMVFQANNGSYLVEGYCYSFTMACLAAVYVLLVRTGVQLVLYGISALIFLLIYFMGGMGLMIARSLTGITFFMAGWVLLLPIYLCFMQKKKQGEAFGANFPALVSVLQAVFSISIISSYLALFFKLLFLSEGHGLYRVAIFLPAILNFIAIMALCSLCMLSTKKRRTCFLFFLLGGVYALSNFPMIYSSPLFPVSYFFLHHVFYLLHGHDFWLLAFIAPMVLFLRMVYVHKSQKKCCKKPVKTQPKGSAGMAMRVGIILQTIFSVLLLCCFSFAALSLLDIVFLGPIIPADAPCDPGMSANEVINAQHFIYASMFITVLSGLCFVFYSLFCWRKGLYAKSLRVGFIPFFLVVFSFLSFASCMLFSS